jgi:transcriptional regulator
VGDAPETFIASQIKGIIGIEIDIVEIEGKWKVSQNRSAADQKGVLDGLTTSTDTDAGQMAELVRRYGKSD